MTNWFNTFNEALTSENLIDLLPTGVNLAYGQILRCAVSGTFFTVFRDQDGRYERPIQYKTKMQDFCVIYNFNE